MEKSYKVYEINKMYRVNDIAQRNEELLQHVTLVTPSIYGTDMTVFHCVLLYMNVFILENICSKIVRKN